MGFLTMVSLRFEECGAEKVKRREEKRREDKGFFGKDVYYNKLDLESFFNSPQKRCTYTWRRSVV